jgi:D-aminopeptidase
MDGEKSRKRPLLEFENPAIQTLFVAVVEMTEDAVINALCTAGTIEGRDGHRMEALPIDETLDIVR